MLGLEQEKWGEGIEFWVHFEGRVETHQHSDYGGTEWDPEVTLRPLT